MQQEKAQYQNPNLISVAKLVAASCGVPRATHSGGSGLSARTRNKSHLVALSENITRFPIM